MKKPHNSPRALASLAAVSLTAATRPVLSGKCQTPKSIPQKQIFPESGKQKVLSPVFQILLFDHSDPSHTNNRLAFSWTATRLAARQLFRPISSFGYSGCYLAFLGSSFPSWKTSGPQGTCCVWDYGVTTLGGRRGPRQYKSKCYAKQFNIFKCLIDEPAASWASKRTIKTGTRNQRSKLIF